MEESPTDVVTHKRERGRLRKERTDIDCKQLFFKERCKITWYKALVLLCNLGEKSAK